MFGLSETFRLKELFRSTERTLETLEKAKLCLTAAQNYATGTEETRKLS